jgi:hypothetical protein
MKLQTCTTMPGSQVFANIKCASMSDGQSMPYRYIEKKHNETLKRVGNIMEEVSIFKAHCMNVWYYHNEIPSYYYCVLIQK